VEHWQGWDGEDGRRAADTLASSSAPEYRTAGPGIPGRRGPPGQVLAAQQAWLGRNRYAARYGRDMLVVRVASRSLRGSSSGAECAGRRGDRLALVLWGPLA
jgi:hypothetical protein